MPFSVSAAWNLASFVVCLAFLVYGLRLYKEFRGGKLSRGYSFTLGAILVALLTFFVSLALNLVGVTPLATYGVSVKDGGILISLVLFTLALRELSLFWNPKTTMSR